MFWFSMKFYTPTVEFLRDNTDFTIDDFPLIWSKSDNVGILPDPSRGPRRIYETALFGYRGDRKIVQAVANSYAAPSDRSIHMSVKPVPMLRHFFRMFVDANSIVLDPTCGSGSALRAADAAGAAHVFGLEVNPEFAERSIAEFVRDRKLRRASEAAE
jgi:DNA modification methylase